MDTNKISSFLAWHWPLPAGSELMSEPSPLANLRFNWRKPANKQSGKLLLLTSRAHGHTQVQSETPHKHQFTNHTHTTHTHKEGFPYVWRSDRILNFALLECYDWRSLCLTTPEANTLGGKKWGEGEQICCFFIQWDWINKNLAFRRASNTYTN